MTPALAVGDWLTLVGREYLDEFVPAGGAAIKFAVPLDESARRSAIDGMADAADRRGLRVTRVDATTTRVHLMDQLFFAISAQVPWREFALALLRPAVAGRGWRLPEPLTEPVAESIARLNGIEAGLVHSDIDQYLSREVMRDARLARDFRFAIAHLCRAAARGGEEGETTREALIGWLTGENRLLSAVRPYHIHTRLNRANARNMLASLLNLLRLLGRPGLLVVLDLARLDVTQNPRDGGRFYTRAAVLDAYELLRQFIDGTDRLAGLVMLVVPSTGFLAEETGGRGVGAYEALKFRIWDEVRDRRLVNPMSALVRLAGDDNGNGNGSGGAS